MNLSIDKLQPTKTYRCKRHVEGGSEEWHSYTLGNLNAGTEINYNCYGLDRKFSYAFSWTISYRDGNEDTILIDLNKGYSYRSRHDFNVDMKRAKILMSYLKENPSVLEEIRAYVKENGRIKIY